jgi:AcrR family transcriptional regulator
MVLDVLDRLMIETAEARPVVPGEGVEAIYGWLRGLIDFLSGPGRGALLALSHARRRQPDLAEALDRIMAEDRSKFLSELRAILGPKVPDERLDRLLDVLLGAIFFRVSLRDRPMDDSELRTLITEQIEAASGSLFSA